MKIGDRVTAAPAGVPAAPDERTRDRVWRAVLEQGPLSATHLAARLGLTPAAGRRHLDALSADGLGTVLQAPPGPPPAGGGGRGRAGPAGAGGGGRAAPPLRRDRPRPLPGPQRLRRPGHVGPALPARHRRRGRRPGLRRAAGRRARASLPARARGRRRRPGRAHAGPGGGADIRRVRRHGPRRRPPDDGGAALPGALPGPARRPGVPRAVRGRDGRVLAFARSARAAPGHAGPRRPRVHDPRTTFEPYHFRRKAVRMTTTARPELEGIGRYDYGWADSDSAGASARRGLS